jgi:hypothetical protein
VTASRRVADEGLNPTEPGVMSGQDSGVQSAVP